MIKLNSIKHIGLVCVLSTLSFTTQIHAATVFFDGFEDNNLDGWAQSNTGGAGTFDVVQRNASSRAHIGHSSATNTGDSSSLSMTFDFTATDVVSFDMEAVAFLSQFGGRIRHGLAGVEVTFLNTFNVSLGSAGLFNVTSDALLGANDFSILNTQQNYNATMAEFADLAGLVDTSSIAKMSISFLAEGSFSSGGGVQPNVRSGGNVWFDNFSVSPVPVPAAVWLFASGLLGLMGVARRNKVS